MSLLTIRDLSIRFDGMAEPVLCGIDLTLAAGQVAALVGESGSGKTLLSRSLIRLLPPGATLSAAEMRLNGQDLLTADETALRRLRGGGIGFVFQEPLSSLNPTLKIGLQLTEALRIHRRLDRHECRRRAIAMLDRMHIRDPETCLDRYPHKLSGGMRQRVMLAAALITEPKLIIADEPTTALDVLVQADVIGLLRLAAQDLGCAVLIVTHDLSVVAQAAEQVHVMERGRIVDGGPPAALFAAPSHPYTSLLLSALPGPPPVVAPIVHKPAELLSVRGLSVRFQPSGGWPWRRPVPVTALDGIDLDLGAGETLAVIGESGSGKTTLGRAVAGLQPFHAGEILVEGRRLADLRAHERRVQYIFQDPMAALDPRMSVAGIVGEGLLFAGIDAAERARRVATALERVHLDPARFGPRLPHQLSGGQRQRVNIARAIACEPRLIVADEPVAALDLTVQKQVVDLFRALSDSLGFGCLFITHDLGVVEHVADRLAVLHHGKLVEQGATAELFRRPRHPYTAQLVAATPCVEPMSGGGYRFVPRAMNG